jgi:type IV pilus assembly protein PilY1
MRAKFAKFRMTIILGLAASAGAGLADAPSISDNPLFLVSAGRANVLVILDNSNSMDEDASGAAVGSANAASKSEISRGVIRTLIDAYAGKINMGLMAYKQNATSDYYLHNSPYDVSYDPADYDSSWTGDRADPHHKKYRVDNPASGNAADFIHYNVALPFYAGSNQGNGFCYSDTAVAFNNGEDPNAPCTVNSTTWDSYRCYSTKTGSSNGLPAMNDSNAGAYGYSGSVLYAGVPFCPTDSDLAQGITDFGRFNTYNYVSRTYFVNNSPGRGYLHTPIKLLDSTQATALKNKLKCNIPGAGSPCDTTNGLKNAGLTPIEGTLLTAKDYFGGSWNATSEGYVAGTAATSSYPLPESCGKNFVILLTDGLPSTDKNGNVLTNPTTAISQAAAAAAALKTAGIETYVVGFALPYGVDPATLDTIAASGGTNTAYNANDSATLNSALSSIFSDILSKTTSAAAIAANSTRINTETLVYQARFNSAEWSGQVLAFKLNEDGTLGAVRWDTDTTLASVAYDTRKVWAWNGSSGVGFAWDNLSASQQAALNKNGSGTTDNRGQDRVFWLRGLAVGGFRVRAKLLGDIVNSDPAFVAAENYGYVVHAEADDGGEGYLNFLTTKQSRKKMLYVGANDGLLHGFDADTGAEQFAYIPAGAYDRLSKLTDPAYSHRYVVDGSPIAWDACIGPAGTYVNSLGATVATNCTWRTILLGSLGAGGKAVYALDITEPTSVNFGKPLWEFSHNDLGYLSGPPQVIKLQSGEWAAIFGNGYRSKNCEDLINNVTNASRNCNAKLFAVNLATGAPISGFPLDTGVGDASNANGFVAAPALYDYSTRILGDENDSGSTLGDGIYIGDLRGNVWRFLYKTSGGWQVAYKTGSTPTPLFVAKDNLGNVQPITAPLEVGEPPISGQGAMVYVGTGRYFADTDPSNTARQTFYGLWDQGAKIAYANRDDVLQAQTIINETVAFSRNVRLVSNTAVTWTGGSAKSGWYMDLVSPPIPPSVVSVNRGERVVSAPLLRFGRVIFNTLIPSASACSAGGTSWLMEVDALTGGRLGYSVFDLNNDKLFNSDDYVNDNSGVPVPVSGLGSPVGITKTPAVVSAGESEYKVQTGTDLGGADQGLLVTTEKGGTGKPRGAWRQLFQD